jgi:hypothetical protein
LADNAFHLHVDCRRALGVIVAGNGQAFSSTGGVRSTRTGAGQYSLSFPANISACAPVGTAATAGGSPVAAQVYLAMGNDPKTLQVGVYTAHQDPIDAAFAIIVTCTESPEAVYASSDGFYNKTPIANVSACALTASWVNTSAGGAPSNGGYVSTWYLDANNGVVQTKNQSYGVQGGNGVDLVATC